MLYLEILVISNDLRVLEVVFGEEYVLQDSLLIYELVVVGVDGALG